MNIAIQSQNQFTINKIKLYPSFCPSLMKAEVRQNIFANSTSKQKWSFSKSRRFINPNAPDTSYYDTPSSLDKRSASFGFGKRQDISKTINVSGDPAKYNILSNFDTKNRGFSFGTGRDQTKFQNYLKIMANTSAIYKVDDTFFHKGRAYSIKQKTAYPPNYFLPNDPETQRRSKLPGPSSYETIDNLGEKCVSSNKKNIGHRFSHSQRFNRMKTYEIGPGSYDDKTITADGEYVLSNMRSSGKRTIFKGKRTNIFVKNETLPGPGDYDVMGDFGMITMKQTLNNSTILDQKPKRPQTARN